MFTFSQNHRSTCSLAWDQAPQRGKRQTGLNGKKISASEASPGLPGEGERAAEPGDMPSMSPFHDTGFWYHALIGKMSSC